MEQIIFPPIELAIWICTFLFIVCVGYILWPQKKAEPFLAIRELDRINKMERQVANYINDYGTRLDQSTRRIDKIENELNATVNQQNQIALQTLRINRLEEKVLPSKINNKKSFDVDFGQTTAKLSNKQKTKKYMDATPKIKRKHKALVKKLGKAVREF